MSVRGSGWRAVGRVVALYRHPIKSMAAQAVPSVTVDQYGIEGDRRYALRRCGDASGFPWLTASKVPALVTYRVEGTPPMRLRTLGGVSITCDGDSIARHFADAHGVDIEFVHLTHGMFDCAGLSIITRQTIAALEAVVGMPLDVRRFRPNIVIDVDASSESYPEDSWVGHAIAFDETGPIATVSERDERCVMINLDPDTGRSSAEILKGVVRARDNCAGVYALPARLGSIAVGDVAFIRE